MKRPNTMISSCGYPSILRLGRGQPDRSQQLLGRSVFTSDGGTDGAVQTALKKFALKNLAAPLALFAIALSLRIGMLIVAPFDGLYGQDAYEYLKYAREVWAFLAAGEGLRGPYYWPLGYPALAAPFVGLSGGQAFGAQIVSLLAGSAVAPLAYAICRELLRDDPVGGKRAGLVAGVLLAVSGQLWQSSLVIMTDATAVFLATLSLWALLRSMRDFQQPWLTLSAAALALAAITRWIFLLLAIPWTVYWFLQARARWRVERHGIPSIALTAFAVALAILGAQFAITARFPAALVGHSWLINWSPTNAFLNAFNTIDGFFEYDRPVGLFYLAPALHPFYLAPWLAPLIPLGLWTLRRRRELLLFAGWPLVIYIFLAGIPYQNFRFGLAYFAPLVILLGLGYRWLWELRQHWPRPLIAIVVATGLLAMLGYGALGVGDFLKIKRNELADTAWVQQNAPADATLLTFGLTLTLQHYTDFDVVELYRETPESLDALICERPATYLYVDKANIQSQWVGLPPEVNLRWLEANPGLTALGKSGRYSLARIGACSSG